MSEKIINPITKRLITKNGPTFKKLVQDKIIDENGKLIKQQSSKKSTTKKSTSSKKSSTKKSTSIKKSSSIKTVKPSSTKTVKPSSTKKSTTLEVPFSEILASRKISSSRSSSIFFPPPSKKSTEKLKKSKISKDDKNMEIEKIISLIKSAESKTDEEIDEIKKQVIIYLDSKKSQKNPNIEEKKYVFSYNDELFSLMKNIIPSNVVYSGFLNKNSLFQKGSTLININYLSDRYDDLLEKSRSFHDLNVILIFIRFGEFDITSHQKHEIVLRDLKHRIENYEQNNKIYVHLLHFKNTTPHSDNPTFELLYPKLNDIKNSIKNEINN